MSTVKTAASRWGPWRPTRPPVWNRGVDHPLHATLGQTHGAAGRPQFEHVPSTTPPQAIAAMSRTFVAPSLLIVVSFVRDRWLVVGWRVHEDIASIQ